MTHTVQAGDTLKRIAERHGSTVAAFLAANPDVPDGDVIFPGQVLNVPKDAIGSVDVAEQPLFVSTYTVRSGDSLRKIALHFGVSLEDLIAANPQVSDPDLVRPGQLLNVPSKESIHQTTPVTPVPQSGLPLWLAMAKREMDTGVDEIAGPTDNPRIVEYHRTTTLRATDDETFWCSSFVNWCVIQARLEGTDSAAARSWLQWGQPLERGRQGAVTVFRRSASPTAGHVGFYWGSAKDRVLVLGGNQGDQVSIKGYPKKDLLGFRWPPS